MKSYNLVISEKSRIKTMIYNISWEIREVLNHDYYIADDIYSKTFSYTKSNHLRLHRYINIIKKHLLIKIEKISK